METTINQDIRAALDRLGPGEPIALAAVSGDHAHFLDNWLLFLDRLKIDRVMIVAMDEVMAARMRPGRFPVIRAGFDGTEADFWRQRLRVWRRLADAGVAFIQSDTDAIWLSDPRPMLAGLDGDLVFSQGTRLPEDTLEAWGFVLCCGFFLARPTPATIALFAEIGPGPLLRNLSAEARQVRRRMRQFEHAWDWGAHYRSSCAKPSTGVEPVRHGHLTLKGRNAGTA